MWKWSNSTKTQLQEKTCTRSETPAAWQALIRFLLPWPQGVNSTLMPRLLVKPNSEGHTHNTGRHTHPLHPRTHTHTPVHISHIHVHIQKSTRRAMQQLSTTHTLQPCHRLSTHTNTIKPTVPHSLHSTIPLTQTGRKQMCHLLEPVSNLCWWWTSPISPCCSWIFWDKGLLWNYTVIRMTALIRYWDWISHLLGSLAEEWFDLK